MAISQEREKLKWDDIQMESRSRKRNGASEDVSISDELGEGAVIRYITGFVKGEIG